MVEGDREFGQKKQINYYAVPQVPYLNPEQGLSETYFNDLVGKYGKDKALLIFADHALEAFKVQPEFLGDVSNRDKLRSEGGIVFSNHPGSLDIPIILNAMRDEQRKVRDDFLILMGGITYERFVKIFGDKHIVPADRRQSEEVFNKILQHIEQGGLFIIFPTGTSEEHGDFEFENGLAYLLEKVKPETMVYHFAINANDENSVHQFQKGGIIKVKEGHSQAQEWQKVMEGAKNRFRKSQLLRKYFVDLYNPNWLLPSF
jgi:hypothetical protein